MKYYNQNDGFLVKVEKEDIEAFNKAESAQLPTRREIVFGFKKGSGDLIRVEPKTIRVGNMAWERLRDQALAFGQRRIRHA